MKLLQQIIILLAMLIIWQGCTTQLEPEGGAIKEGPKELDLKIEEVPSAPVQFLSRSEVLEELKVIKGKGRKFMDEPLDAAGKLRESHLIPDSEFITPDLKEAHKLLKAKSVGLVKSKGVPKDAPQEVDLRLRDTPIKHQDDGKCTAYSGVAGIENLLNRRKEGPIPGLNLSEWHAWSFYRQYSADAFVKALTTNAIGDEKDYPQYGVPGASLKGYAQLVQTEFIGDDDAKAIEELGKGNPVYLAMKTPKEMLSCKKVISPSTGAASGGHALLMVGYYLDQGKVVGIIRNSWGADCGDHGYQYMPLSICHKRGFYCSMWAFQEASAAPLPAPDPAKPDPDPAPVPSLKPVCKRLWYAPWKKVCN